MKPTDAFKNTIQQHIEQRATADPLFAETLKKEGKNIDDCITYIFNQVKKSGCNGFTDDEIFGMAVHYYDEDSIEVGKPVNCNVVVNHTVELTEEEKQRAKDKAVEQAIKEEKEKLIKRQSKKQQTQNLVQPGLF